MKILFVCTGNTCRSCMAESIFNSMCINKGIIAASAGLSVIKNSKTSKNAVAILEENIKVNLEKRDAVQLSKEMLIEADLILTMTSIMKTIIRSNFPTINEKIYTLKEYVGLSGDVIDPYGGNLEQYLQTFNELTSCISVLIDKINEDRGIK